MESLLSTYASSDEEDDHPQPTTTTTTTTITNPSPSSSSLFSSLPKPQSSSSSSSSSIFSSKEEEDLKPPSKPSSFFSALPVPKSQPTKTTPDFSLPPPIPKRVVQFHPPLPHPLSNNPKNLDKDDEEDEEEKQRKKKRQLGHDTSVKSFLSSMPTPKNSLGSSLGGGSTSSGSGRRSIVETEGSVLSNDGKCEVGIEYNVENGEENWSNGSNSQNYEAGIDQNYVGYEGYGGGYDSYGSYGQYEASWSAPESSVQVESFVNMGGGKRRKDQVPVEILEVKQDELMKDRPREDKSRLTGIAFGPSYQPTSTKGKPSKLHKRKHQIGSLYFDMKQKEMELAERRSKGLLTKAETQAKYGW